MSSTRKSSNIYLNPMFNDIKSVIHINPKVHLNMAIHVNPKMINIFSSSAPKLESKINELPIGINTQKSSVYVNPKLMEKLKTRVPDTIVHNSIKNVANNSNILINHSTNKSSTMHFNNPLSINNKMLSPKKSTPSKFISLSKRKLIRVRPSPTKSNFSSTINMKISPTVIKKVQKPIKSVNINQLKKVNTTNAMLSNSFKSKLSVQSTKNRYKIDRTKVEKQKSMKVLNTARKGVSRNNTNLIKIDGVLYKTTKSQLVRSKLDQKKVSKTSQVNLSMKNKYKLTKTGARISRTKLSSAKSSSSRSSTCNSFPKANYKHIVSNRVKQKSIQILRQKMTKNNQPCLLFRRFGFCAKFNAGNCPNVHDKKQVALCKNFLQGKCLLDNCPLSHEVGPEKMPTCKYFLDGCCVRENCQYLHVKVSSNTSICKSFLQGYCEKGTKCKERHINICPEFEKVGKCTKGKNCPYPHKSHKSSLLAQHKITSKNSKLTITFDKQKKCPPSNDKLDKIASLPRVDDSKKRYYDDNSCFDNDEEESNKRLKIYEINDGIKSVHSNKVIEVIDISSDSDSDLIEVTVVNHNKHQLSEDFSQPSSKRPPLGPLPAYIPI